MAAAAFRGAPVAGFGGIPAGGAPPVAITANNTYGQGSGHLPAPVVPAGTITSHRRYREESRMYNSRRTAPTQRPAAGTFPDELLRTVKYRGAAKYASNGALRNSGRIEQILGIRKVFDPDEQAVMRDHPFQYALGNPKIVKLMKDIKSKTRELESRASFIASIEPHAIRDAHPTFFKLDPETGKLRYHGPQQMLNITNAFGAFNYMFKPGDTFCPIRGGLYNPKAKNEFHALEHMQLKRERMQESYEEGFK